MDSISSQNYHFDSHISASDNRSNDLNSYYSPATASRLTNSLNISDAKDYSVHSDCATNTSSSFVSAFPQGNSPLQLTATHSASGILSHSAANHRTNSVHDITSGCSRTIPVAWNHSNTSANSLLQVSVTEALVRF